MAFSVALILSMAPAWADEAAIESRLRTVAGLEPVAVGQTLAALQAAVRSGDAAGFADRVQFPQIVLIDGHRTIVETRAGFCRNFSAIVNDRVRHVVLQQRFPDLFVNWRGCMFGSGELWLGSEAKVVCIRNWPDDVRFDDLPLRYLAPNGREIIPALGPARRGKALERVRAISAHDGDNALPDLGDYRSAVYEADVNNDGHDELVVAVYGQGSGGYSSVAGVYQPLPNGGRKLPFESIVVKSLFPDGDMSRFHLSLAVPFLVRKGGTVYMGFADGVRPIYYRWDRDDRFAGTDIDREKPKEDR